MSFQGKLVVFSSLGESVGPKNIDGTNNVSFAILYPDVGAKE